jgi:hypothetical protein
MGEGAESALRVNFVKYEKIPNPFFADASSLLDDWEELFKAGTANLHGSKFIGDPVPGVAESKIELIRNSFLRTHGGRGRISIAR